MRKSLKFAKKKKKKVAQIPVCKAEDRSVFITVGITIPLNVQYDIRHFAEEPPYGPMGIWESLEYSILSFYSLSEKTHQFKHDRQYLNITQLLSRDDE